MQKMLRRMGKHPIKKRIIKDAQVEEKEVTAVIAVIVKEKK